MMSLQNLLNNYPEGEKNYLGDIISDLFVGFDAVFKNLSFNEFTLGIKTEIYYKKPEITFNQIMETFTSKINITGSFTLVLLKGYTTYYSEVFTNTLFSYYNSIYFFTCNIDIFSPNSRKSKIL